MRAAVRIRRAPRVHSVRARRTLTLAATLAACAGLVSGCGDTLQSKPIPHSVLETLIVAPFPVYWLGGHFEKLAITEATHDPSGAFTVQYGDCLRGGQGTCTPPLRVVTSPDNSFVPGGDTQAERSPVRDTSARLSDAGRTIAIATGPVVVEIFASNAGTARAAARGIAAINSPIDPGEPLPARLPDTGFGSTPLPSQLPATVRPLG
jgi:hypothetical protein